MKSAADVQSCMEVPDITIIVMPGGRLQSSRMSHMKAEAAMFEKDKIILTPPSTDHPQG